MSPNPITNIVVDDAHRDVFLPTVKNPLPCPAGAIVPVEYKWGKPPPGFSFAWPYFTSWTKVRVENRGGCAAYNVTASVTGAPI